jgi:hypothetical protein
MPAGNVDGNLQSMKPMTNEAQADVAAGWLDSSLSQAEYARLVGIAPRTLRLYLQRHAGRQAKRQASAPGDIADIKKLQGGIDRLLERVDALNARVDALQALLLPPKQGPADQPEPGMLRQAGGRPAGPAADADTGADRAASGSADSGPLQRSTAAATTTSAAAKTAEAPADVLHPTESAAKKKRRGVFDLVNEDAWSPDCPDGPAEDGT